MAVGLPADSFAFEIREIAETPRSATYLTMILPTMCSTVWKLQM